MSKTSDTLLQRQGIASYYDHFPTVRLKRVGVAGHELPLIVRPVLIERRSYQQTLIFGPTIFSCNNPKVSSEMFSEMFEARLANGETEVAESLWGARHIIARRVAFDEDPLNPRNVLPAEIWKTGTNLFGGRAFVEKIFTAAELSTNG